jgi:hypothetical protein
LKPDLRKPPEIPPQASIPPPRHHHTAPGFRPFSYPPEHTMKQFLHRHTPAFMLIAALAVVAIGLQMAGLIHPDAHTLLLAGVGMTAADGFIGSGDVYFNPWDATTGTHTGFVLFGNATKFETKTPSDQKDMISRGRDTPGQLLNSVGIPKPAELDIQFNQVNVGNLPLILMGSAADLSQGSGTITGQSVTIALDRWVDLGKKNLSDTGLTVAHGGTPYVEGTDYVVNHRLGMLKALSTGTIPAAQVVTVGATYSAVSGTRISAATQTQIRGQVRLDGKNFATGDAVVVDVDEAILVSEKGFDFLFLDFQEAELKGKMRTLPGKTSPFTVDYLSA